MNSTNYIKSVYNKFINNNSVSELFLLEPMSTIIRLAMLTFCENGSKIAIYNNKIYVQEPNYFQPLLRKIYGSNRSELSHLLRPIAISKSKYDKKEKSIKNIFKFAVKGLKKLKISYNNETNMTCHCLQLYINYIESELKEPTEFNKIGKFELDDFSSKLYEEYYKLWSSSQLDLVSKLLNEANKCEKERYNLIIAINSIVELKENQSNELIKKYTKNLKK